MLLYLFSYETHVSTHQNNPKNLDPSVKTVFRFLDFRFISVLKGKKKQHFMVELHKNDLNIVVILKQKNLL